MMNILKDEQHQLHGMLHAPCDVNIRILIIRGNRRSDMVNKWFAMMQNALFETRDVEIDGSVMDATLFFFWFFEGCLTGQSIRWGPRA
jgi:hypothetical protein